MSAGAALTFLYLLMFSSLLQTVRNVNETHHDRDQFQTTVIYLHAWKASKSTSDRMEMAWESDTLPAIVFVSSAKVDRVLLDQKAPNQGP